MPYTFISNFIKLPKSKTKHAMKKENFKDNYTKLSKMFIVASTYG